MGVETTAAVVQEGFFIVSVGIRMYCGPCGAGLVTIMKYSKYICAVSHGEICKKLAS